MSSGQCCLCHREIKGNGDFQKKIITCSRCVQILLNSSREDKVVYREKLILQGHLEEARCVESFISEEEVINEASRKFRRTVERKRAVRAIRIKTRERRPFGYHQLLG